MFILCALVFCTLVCVCDVMYTHTQTPVRVLDPLELELQGGVSCRVGAGD